MTKPNSLCNLSGGWVLIKRIHKKFGGNLCGVFCFVLGTNKTKEVPNKQVPIIQDILFLRTFNLNYTWSALMGAPLNLCALRLQRSTTSTRLAPASAGEGAVVAIDLLAAVWMTPVQNSMLSLPCVATRSTTPLRWSKHTPHIFVRRSTMCLLLLSTMPSCTWLLDTSKAYGWGGRDWWRRRGNSCGGDWWLLHTVMHWTTGRRHCRDGDGQWGQLWDGQDSRAKQQIFRFFVLNTISVWVRACQRS